MHLPVHLAASRTWPAAFPAQSCAETVAATASPCMLPSAKLLFYLLLAPAVADAAASDLVTQAARDSTSDLVQLACLSQSLCRLGRHQNDRHGQALLWHKG